MNREKKKFHKAAPENSAPPAKPANTVAPKDADTAPPAAQNTRSWDHIESDLKDALNTWSDLTQELADKVSPEEEQLSEIKTLLGTLRDKLKEFSEDNTAKPEPEPKSDLEK
jgi:hypothetical protein